MIHALVAMRAFGEARRHFGEAIRLWESLPGSEVELAVTRANEGARRRLRCRFSLERNCAKFSGMARHQRQCRSACRSCWMRWRPRIRRPASYCGARSAGPYSCASCTSMTLPSGS